MRNTKELLDDFKGRLDIEVRCQEGIEKRKERSQGKDEYRRMKLPGKYMVKMLYRWDDRKFEEEYLKKLERDWQK